MPSTYAHRRFGANVLEHLPDELRAQLEQNRELYDIGLHGPDLLFYYHAASSNPVSALGNAMHDKPGRVFFDRARGVVKAAGDREKLCFLHYPPLYLHYTCPEILHVLSEYGVHECCYGHIHGYGCRSIQTIAQQRGGLCQFLAEDGTFLLRVMLPAKSTA